MPLEVDADDEVEVLLAHVEEHPVPQEPGVVHQDVELPEPVDRRLHEAERVVPVGDVAVVGHRFAAGGRDLVHHGVGGALLLFSLQGAAVVVDDDAGSEEGELEGLGPSQPAPGPGHDRDLAVHPFEHQLSRPPPKSGIRSSP